MAATAGTSTDRDAPGIHDTTSVKRGKRSSQGAWSLHTPWTGLAQPEGFCSGWMVLCSTAPWGVTAPRSCCTEISGSPAQSLLTFDCFRGGDASAPGGRRGAAAALLRHVHRRPPAALPPFGPRLLKV